MFCYSNYITALPKLIYIQKRIYLKLQLQLLFSGSENMEGLLCKKICVQLLQPEEIFGGIGNQE